MRAAAAAEHERPVWEFRGERERLELERVFLDDAGLGKVERQVRGLGHRLTVLSPGARHADEACAPLAPACMTLVLRSECDCGERAAVRTFRAEPAHAGTSSFRVSASPGRSGSSR